MSTHRPESSGQVLLDELSMLQLQFERFADPASPNLPKQIELEFDTVVDAPAPTRRTVRATMALFNGSERPPFKLEITYVVRASVEKEEDAKLLDAFSETSAIGLLVPYFREAIASTVQRSGLPAVLLPPINISTLQSLAARGIKRTKSG